MPAIHNRSRSPYAKPLTRRRVAEPENYRRPRSAYHAQRAAVLSVLAALSEGQTLSGTELVEVTGLPVNKQALPDLVAEGLIEGVGLRNRTRYKITEHGRSVSTTEETR